VQGTDLSLSDSVDRFLTRLAVRLMNTQSGSSSSAEAAASTSCVAEQIDRLQAFGDTSRRLTRLVRRSFIVARNFVLGLRVGRDVIAAAVDNVRSPRVVFLPSMQVFFSPNIAQIPLVASRHATTRYLAHAFWHRKSRHNERDRRDSHDTSSVVSPPRGLGWTCPPHLFHKLFLRLMQIQSTKY